MSYIITLFLMLNDCYKYIKNNFYLKIIIENDKINKTSGSWTS